jgi:uncharacterized protein (TIGR02145 family)
MKKSFFLPAMVLAISFAACENGGGNDGDQTPPEPTQYSIAVSVTGTGGTAGATIDGTKAVKAAAGTTITLTATADPDYEFTGWTTPTAGVTFADATSSSTTFTMPESNVAIVAAFEETVPPPARYNITLNSATGGTVKATVGGEPTTEAAENDEVTLTATPEGAYEFVRWTVTDADNKASVLTTSPAKFAMPAGAVTIDVQFAVPPAGGVIIGGAIWATCNVDAPGTFAATPESAGMYYQWGRNIGWSAADPLAASDGRTEWDETYYEGTEWTAVNDPSPAGWRVPTADDFRNLFNAKNRDAGLITIGWVSANGTKPAGRLVTDTTTGNSIFFPAMGWRTYGTDTIFEYVGGKLQHVGTDGYYWSSSQAGSDRGYQLTFDDNSSYPAGNSLRNFGFSIRPVAE